MQGKFGNQKKLPSSKKKKISICLICLILLKITFQGDPTKPLLSIIKWFFFKIVFILLLERGKGREKERERNSNVQEIHQLFVSHTPPTGDLACNPGMCPDWESNQRPLGSFQFTGQHSVHWTTPARAIIKGFKMQIPGVVTTVMWSRQLSIILLSLKTKQTNFRKAPRTRKEQGGEGGLDYWGGTRRGGR